MMRLPIHPLLVALLPVLSMYAWLPGRADGAEVLRSCAFALVAAAVLMTIAYAVFRDARKAALMASIALVVYIVVGRVYGSVESWELGGFVPFRRRFVVPAVYLGLAALGVFIYRIRRPLGTATALANVLAFGMLLPPALSLANVQIAAVRKNVEMPALAPILREESRARRPDIYYIIFDRYGDREALRAHGIENEAAYRYLRAKGFYIAEQSRANYIKTALSLASSLNLDYLDDLTRAYGRDSSTWAPIYHRARHHRVNAFLREQGYRTFHLGSWYGPTRVNPDASRNINYYDVVPLPLVQLLNNVLFEPVQRALDSPLVSDRRQHWHRVVRQIDDVIELAGQPGPKFVFLHVLVPHPPFVFDRDGSYVPLEVENRRTRDKNFGVHVDAANGLMRRLVDGVLARSAAPPVMVIQGDEGPYPPGTESDYYRWTEASVSVLRERAGILNAYFLPGGDRRALYPHISPVNSFRVVFNQYLGTRLPLLPDRTMRHASGVHPLAFDDVTQAVTDSRGTAALAEAARPPISPEVATVLARPAGKD